MLNTYIGNKAMDQPATLLIRHPHSVNPISGRLKVTDIWAEGGHSYRLNFMLGSLKLFVGPKLSESTYFLFWCISDAYSNEKSGVMYNFLSG